MTLPPEHYLRTLRADGDALIVAARKDMRARVPSCPDWDVAELVAHTTSVHRHKAAIVRASTDPSSPPDVERPEAPSEDGELLRFYADGLEDMLKLFSETDPEKPAWTWGKGTTVGWWLRRMAQETAVHRWDAQNAVGDPTSIDAVLAADGIHEFVDEFIPGEEIAWTGAAGTVHIHCTDVPGEWTVTLEPGRVPTFEPGHSKGDAALRGSAENLLLVLWRRVEPSRVEILGDTELVNALWSYLRGPGQ